MDKKRFWSIVESAKRKSGKNPDAMRNNLLDELLKLSAAEIYRWGQYYAAYHMLSETEPLYMAAYVMNSGGDDGFEYFRGWLIAQGEKVYKEALANPDSLAKLRISIDDEFWFEHMMGMGYEAYADKLNETGEVVDEQPLSEEEIQELRSELVFADSTGLDSEEACIGQIPKRIPNLCKKFGFDNEGDELDSNSLSNGEAEQLAAAVERNASKPVEIRVSNGHAFFMPLSNDKEIPKLATAANIESLQIHQGKQLKDISSIADYTSLKQLKFESYEYQYEQLDDFSVFYQLTLLEELNISGMPNLSSIDFVRNMPQLKRIVISHMPNLTDISAIEGLAELEMVILYGCPMLTTIPSLWASAKKLKDIRIMDIKQLQNVDALKGLTELEGLWLRNNGIEDITPLADCTKLVHLDLSQNKLSSIDALKNMHYLTHLDLSYNKIVDISPLSHISTIKFLSLKSNKIVDISALQNVKNAEYISLSKNKELTDVSPLCNAHIGCIGLNRTAAASNTSALKHVGYIDTVDL